MAWIFVDKEGESGMRSQMRRNMRGGYRYDGAYPMMRDGSESKEHWYRMGYRHGWEDGEEEHDIDYRRARDSRGRYV